MHKVDAGEYVPTAGKLTFDDMAGLIEADYRTSGMRSFKRIAISLTHLRQHLGDTRPSDISFATLSAYVSTRLAEGAARASVNNELAALNRMFNLAVDAARLPLRQKFPKSTASPARREFFEPAQLDAVVVELPKWWQPVILAAAITGWRTSSELVPLRWSQVDLAAGTLRIEPGDGKTGEGRTWPASEHSEPWQIILGQRELVTQFGTPLVFFRVVYGEARPLGSYAKAWATATQEAAVAHRKVHDLWRTAIRDFDRAAISRSVAVSLRGHKTASVFARYSIFEIGAQRDGMAKLTSRNS